MFRAGLALAGGLWLLGCGDDPGAPARAETKRLNVLVITVDTLRADALGIYGQTRPTSPSIDRLAREGVVFEQCASSSPSTLPSHATIFTGKHPYAHGARSNLGFVLPTANVTLAERMQDAGWVTGAEIASRVIGRPSRLAQGFDHYRDVSSPGVRPKSAAGNERDARDITERGIDFLRRHRDEPFLLWLHYFDPHMDYDPPTRHAEVIPDSPYHAEVRFTDEQIGRVIASLDALGLRDRTLIAITSDHGEGLGQHGETTHTFFVYESTMRVPLILVGPGIPAGRRVPGLVRTLDIAPTILDELDLPPLPDAQGISLGRVARGEAQASEDRAYGESIEFRTNFGGDVLRFEREGAWKYIHAWEPRLYDLASDPGEEQNLAGERPQTLERLRARLLERLEAGAAAPRGAAVDIDPARQAELVALGYVGSDVGRAFDDVATLALRGPDAGDMAADVEALKEAWTAIQALRDYEDGVRRFQSLRERHPESPSVLRGEAMALLELGRGPEARPLLQQLLEFEPCSTEPRQRLALLYAAERNFAEQRAVLRRGVEACPDNLGFRNNLVYLLATCPDAEIRDGAEAVRLAKPLLEAGGQPDFHHIDSVAAAYAESGDFTRAARLGRRAVALARKGGAPAPLLAALEQHQKAFEAGKPVREK
jgi:arylsulfatase A-like enzyme